jgi:hypothetical protein
VKCIVCSNDFSSNYSHQKTCSKVCSEKLQKTHYKKWIKSHKEYVNKKKREYYAEKDKVRIAEKLKLKRKTKEFKKLKKESEKKRLLRDPLYKARKSLRKRLWEYKKRFGSISMSKSVGSWEDFKSHIESQFQPGMTWENYGKNGWEIDHIIPLCSASSLEELEKLNHYTNLRPLWREQNTQKSIFDRLLIRSDKSTNGYIPT